MRILLSILFINIGLYVANAQHMNDINSPFLNGITFKPNKEFYIYGDAVVIGNNILSEDKIDPFNELQVNNDDVKMRHVDIDTDKSTFNSSQATLVLPNDFRKIAYAGLYWAGTYPYQKGSRSKKRGRYVYKGNKKLSSVLNQIKFKLPNQDYKNIVGQLVFDGFAKRKHAENSPYVCYADVTSLLKKAKTVSGNYVAANIKATQGYLSGGSTAGWMLYVVYKSPTEHPKYISTYHGFASVEDNFPLDIQYKNFKSSEKGEVKTSVIVSTLEGDATIEGDEISIVKQSDRTFIPLRGNNRSEKNMFNSTITNNTVKSTPRFPNSKNTLGFDIAKFDIPNKDNETISDATSETTLRLRTMSDRFYMYFTAFQTEIKHNYVEQFAIEKIKREVATVAVEAKPEPYRYKRRGLNSKAFRYLNAKKSNKIEGIQSGYYVITGVFSESVRAGRWALKLIKRGYDVKAFLNPKNNWNYVYLLRSDTPEEAFKLTEELKTKYRYRDTWILKANLD